MQQEPERTDADVDDDVTGLLLSYVERTADFVGVVDAESRVVYMNSAARKRLGFGLGDALTTADLFPPHIFTRYYDEIRPALLLRGTWKGELELLTQSGEAVPMTVSVVGRVGPGGEITGLVTHAYETPPMPVVERVAALVRDDLTDLPMRAILDDRIHIALARATRDNQCIAIVHIDVDSLKDVNDTFGHAVGDEVLRTMADRMSTLVRDADTVARVGGDEFVVLLDGIADGDTALGLVHRIRDAICRTPVKTACGLLTVNCSFGMSVGSPGDHADELLRRADAAMYRAKAMGSGHVVVFDDETEMRVTTIADEFAVAVSHGLIRPHVQPVVDLRTRAILGFQGLARWDHESGETLDAAAFIDLVANTPMAPVVDLAVLRRTAAVAARRARRRPRVRAYGHLSCRLLGDVRIDRYLIEIAEDLSLAPGELFVEVSHQVVARSSHAVRGALLALQEAGIRTVLSELHGECDVNEIVEHGFDELRLARVTRARRDRRCRRAPCRRGHDCARARTRRRGDRGRCRNRTPSRHTARRGM